MSTYEEEGLTDNTALIAFVVALVGLILPVVPAIVALALARRATRNIEASNGLRGGMNYVRGAQVLAALNFVIFAGVLAGAAYLS